MASPPLDAITTELLITGAAEIDDAPPGFDRVAALVNKARGPATAGELAARAATAKMFAANVQSRPVVRAKTKRTFELLKIPAKVLALTVPVVLLGGSVALATGSLPTSAQAAASRALSSFGISVPQPQSDEHAVGGSSPSGTSSVVRGTGVDLGQRSRANLRLCRTWRAGGLDYSSAAYRRLAAAAGGAGNLAAYCAGVPDSSEPDAVIGHAGITSSGPLDRSHAVTKPSPKNRQKALTHAIRSKPRAIAIRHTDAVGRGEAVASTSTSPTTTRRHGPKEQGTSPPLVGSSRRTPVSAGLLAPRGARKTTAPDRSRRHRRSTKAGPGKPSASKLSTQGKPASTSPVGVSPVSSSIAGGPSPSHHRGQTGRARRARGCTDSARPGHAVRAHHRCHLVTPAGSKSNATSIGSKRHDARPPPQVPSVGNNSHSVKHGKTM
jgi:hypothetical protein